MSVFSITGGLSFVTGFYTTIDALLILFFLLSTTFVAQRICDIMSMPASETTILRLVENDVFSHSDGSLLLELTTGLIKTG